MLPVLLVIGDNAIGQDCSDRPRYLAAAANTSFDGWRKFHGQTLLARAVYQCLPWRGLEAGVFLLIT